MAAAVVLSLMGIAVIAKAAYTMTAKKDYWLEVQKSHAGKSDIVCKPNRGNILSCDGQLLAGSIPEYEIFIDFQAGYQKNVPEDTAWTHKRDTLWRDNLDSLCIGLHTIFPQRSVEEFRDHLSKGYAAKKRYWRIWNRKVDYATYKAVQKLPYLRLPRYKGGFGGTEYPARRHPFGSLAERTIGSRDTARYGIELAFDSLLAGSQGKAHLQKVRNKMVTVVTTPAEDGADVISTIDVGMQDLCEQALQNKLQEINALMGVAILMEVPTGDVKAIVNLERCADGRYRELLNHALGYRCEPGSVFKTASMLVALDDGKVDTNYVINTGSGIMKMHGANMKDHNYHRGGYGSINVARTLEVSSNIGVSYVIDHFYGQNPTKYVEGLYRVGIGEDLKLPLNEYRAPKIRFPDTKTTNRSLYWSKTTLPWMSIGYETQVAPINTVTFYNAIANNGRMMRPRFVKQFMKDGEVIQENPPQVIKEQIAKPSTIKTMQSILYKVVSEGLGKKAGNPAFHVSGKTGTAQVAKAGGYKNGVTEYWLSFCGYFPSEDPQYTCIVCMRKAGMPASGGLMSGGIFRKISEGVMAKKVKADVKSVQDSLSIFIPDVKQGDVAAADYVLGHLGINSREADLRQTAAFDEGKMPSVIGMGASDAVYLIEQQGVRVSLHGTGSVHKQSIAPGMTLKPDMTCVLELK